jgi:hypothetical protein
MSDGIYTTEEPTLVTPDGASLEIVPDAEGLAIESSDDRVTVAVEPSPGVEVVTADAAGETVVVGEQVTEVITEGLQGPMGPPGPPGGLVDALAVKLAGEYIGGHRVVVVGADDRAMLADPDNAGHADLIFGVATGASYAGEAVTIRRAGEMREPSWAWEAGKVVFAGAGGVLTQTPPSDGAYLAEVGRAIAPNLIDIKIERSIRR